MLHIRPNYQNPNLKCYYCSRNTPSEEYEERQTLYQVKSGLKLWLGYKYNEVEVHIPRCKDCHDYHYRHSSLFKILWIICSILIFILIYKAAELEPNAGVYIFAIIVSLGLGAALTGLVLKIVNSKKPKKKRIRPLEKYNSYAPIQRLMRLGFLDFKPDPSSGSAYVNEEVTQDDIESAFSKIQTEDDCCISEL